MTSMIDPTVPVFGSPTTASVRNNFLIAKNEITALQNAIGITLPIPVTSGGTGADDILDAQINLGILPITGGNMTGLLRLSGNPTDQLGAVPKQYVDGYFPVAISNGGTGANNAAQALQNLGAVGLFSPAFTGNPTAPTLPTSDNSGGIATTAFVHALMGSITGAVNSVSGGNGISVSPTSGNVTVALLTPVSIANGGTGSNNAAGALANLGAPPASSPAFTGVPTAPTAPLGTSSGQIATTAFVAQALAGVAGGVTSIGAGNGITVNANTGAVVVSLVSPVSVANGGTGSTTGSGGFDAMLGLGGTATGFLMRQSNGAYTLANAPISVSLGGTGAVQLANNAILVGSATAPVRASPATVDGSGNISTPATIFATGAINTNATMQAQIFSAVGPSASHEFAARDNANQNWQIYAVSNIGRLWNSVSGDVLQVDTVGDLSVIGAYIHLANSSGVINGAGGPLIYADPTNMGFKVPGSGAFLFQNGSGTNVVDLDGAGNGTFIGTISCQGINTGNGGITTQAVQAISGITCSTFEATSASGGAVYVPNGGVQVGIGLTIGGITLTNHGDNIWFYGGGAGFLTEYAVSSNYAGTAFYAPNGNFVGEAAVLAVTGVARALDCTNAGGDAVVFAENGGITAAAFNQTSDARVKENIADSTHGLEAVMHLHPKSYNRLNRPDREEHGLIAQDVIEVLGHAVAAIPREGKEELLAIDYSAVTVALVNAVKELNHRLEVMEHAGRTTSTRPTPRR